MTLTFRAGARADVASVVALLADDDIARTRETAPLGDYLAAFARMDARCQLIVGEAQGQIVACYDLIILDGLNMRGARRAQVEGVRIASTMRDHGFGRQLMEDAMTRARKQGAQFIELMSNASRHGAHAFYERLGFTRSHLGFKRNL